jgi:hypothetical protein
MLLPNRPSAFPATDSSRKPSLLGGNAAVVLQLRPDVDNKWMCSGLGKIRVRFERIDHDEAVDNTLSCPGSLASTRQDSLLSKLKMEVGVSRLVVRPSKTHVARVFQSERPRNHVNRASGNYEARVTSGASTPAIRMCKVLSFRSNKT